MDETEKLSTIEKLGTSIDSFRDWIKRSWKLGLLMAKGAYLVGERKRLFVKLGEKTFQRVEEGEIDDTELTPLVLELQKLTKKTDLEEKLVRNLRFEKKREPTSKQAQSEPKSDDPASPPKATSPESKTKQTTKQDTPKSSPKKETS